MNFLQSLAAYFDGNDAHFYAGVAMLFAGLWLNYSLGLALIVAGAVVATVGFVSALLASVPPARKGKR